MNILSEIKNLHDSNNLAVCSKLAKDINASAKPRIVTIEYVQEQVCKYFNISKLDMISRSRKQDVCKPRQIAMFFAKKNTKASLATIANIIGERDHATAMNAIKTISNLMETDKKFRSQLIEIGSYIN
jgi:chromosomal replication initiator protein